MPSVYHYYIVAYAYYSENEDADSPVQYNNEFAILYHNASKQPKRMNINSRLIRGMQKFICRINKEQRFK